MKSIPFPGSNVEVGKGQAEYNSLHAMVVPVYEGELIMCFELTDEEIEKTSTKRVKFIIPGGRLGKCAGVAAPRRDFCP